MRLFQPARDGHLGVAVIAEGIERGGRNGVDGVGTDESIHIQGVGVGGVFGASGSPKRALNAGAEASLERGKARRGENRFKGVVGKFGVGDCRASTQGRTFGQARVNFGIHARDEERGNGGNHVDWFIHGNAVFQSRDVGIHHGAVAFDGKDQRDIDINARRDCLTNGGNALFRGGDFHHQVWAIDPRPKFLRLLNRAFGVVGKVRADFKTDVAVAAFGFIVQRAEKVAGLLNVFNGETPEDFFRVPA